MARPFQEQGVAGRGSPSERAALSLALAGAVADGATRGRPPVLMGPTTAVLALFGSAVLLGLPAVARLDARASRWVTFAVLVCLGVLAQAVVGRTDRERSHRAAAVVALSAAALLLPPEQVVLAAYALYAPRGLQKRGFPWQPRALELSADVFGALAAWGAASAIEAATASLVGAQGAFALAALGACLALAGTARGPRALVTRLLRREPGPASWCPPALGTPTELVLAALGVALAAMWQLNPWLLPFAAAPLLLVQRSFRIPFLEQQARLDPKTGLFNARSFDTALERELTLARVFRRPLAVLVADLDLLREINAAHGHLGGDAVLRGVADILREGLRPTDLAARFGGEEFAAILPATDAGQALQIAERLRHRVASTPFRSDVGGPPIRASVSIGVAAFPDHGTTATELVHLADLAVYRAKLQGRNRVLCATSDPLTGGPRLVAVPCPEAAPADSGEDGTSAPPPAEEAGQAEAPLPSRRASVLLSGAGAAAGLGLAAALGLPHLDTLLSAAALAAALATALLLRRRRRQEAASADEARRKAERLWRAADSLHAQAISLERANRLLRERSAAAMETLSAVVDARDSHTAGHSRRVQRLALAIGREMGLSEAELQVLGQAARFHDIGKLAVPEAILLKPAELDGHEWSVIRRHPEEGARLVGGLGFLADALPAIRHHHERYDGTGYPDGLAGEEIPLGARIIHVADALDAMLTPRVYRPALSPAEALEELRRGAGTQFCPRCLEALDRVMLAELADGADVPGELLAC